MSYVDQRQAKRALKLGETLRKAREGGELSYRDVRERTGLSLAHLQRLERGEVAEPSPSVLHKLSGALDLEYIALMKAIGYIS